MTSAPVTICTLIPAPTSQWGQQLLPLRYRCRCLSPSCPSCDECRHDMRSSVQLPSVSGVDSNIRITVVRRRLLTMTTVYAPGVWSVAIINHARQISGNGIERLKFPFSYLMRPIAYSNSDSNIERQCLWCCHRGTATTKVHPVHLTNVARAPGGWTKPWAIVGLPHVHSP